MPLVYVFMLLFMSLQYSYIRFDLVKGFGRKLAACLDRLCGAGAISLLVLTW